MSKPLRCTNCGHYKTNVIKQWPDFVALVDIDCEGRIFQAIGFEKKEFISKLQTANYIEWRAYA